MKIIAFILALFVTGMTVGPGLNGIFHITDSTSISCCGTDYNCSIDIQDSDNDESKKGCNGKTCNPFHVCCSCMLIAKKLGEDRICNIIVPTERVTFNYISAIDESYSSDFWHPPKMS